MNEWQEEETPPKSFVDWWNTDLEDLEAQNPFSIETPIYWAWAGWKAAKKNELVITKNDKGQIVAVTRQDAEGQIVEVIAESKGE